MLKTVKGQQLDKLFTKQLKILICRTLYQLLGSDGTPIMIGKHLGSIATLEELLQRPLQWAICLLHTNELPLRHVFKHLDSVSASPDSFSGPIGKELNGLVSDWKVVNFRPLSSIEFSYLPQEVIQNLSSDQFYAYQICRAIISGKVENDLAQLEVGRLSHARWLTLGCRILRFYTSQTKPSKNLKILVEFCLKIYFSSWFNIKLNSKITNAAVNYFRMLKQIVQFPHKLTRDLALKTLMRNGFSAHPENIILSMLADSDQIVRSQAVDIVLSSRRRKDVQTSLDENLAEKAVTVRKFNIPEINIKADFYHKMINFEEIMTTEPPAIKSMNNAAIQRFKLDKLELDHPCHNQAVERHVKLVTEASIRVAGF